MYYNKHISVFSKFCLVPFCEAFWWLRGQNWRPISGSSIQCQRNWRTQVYIGLGLGNPSIRGPYLWPSVTDSSCNFRHVRLFLSISKMVKWFLQQFGCSLYDGQTMTRNNLESVATHNYYQKVRIAILYDFSLIATIIPFDLSL